MNGVFKFFFEKHHVSLIRPKMVKNALIKYAEETLKEIAEVYGDDK